MQGTIATYLRRLANWLDPPQSWNVYINCDTSQAIAALGSLQAEFQKMLDKIEWGVKCRKE